jgi:hypothetical protein
MQPEGSILFRSRGEFNEAVLAAIAASRRELTLADRDFSDWPLDSAEGNATLETFLHGDPQARVRVLVADPDWLERRAARLHASRRRFPGSIACRLIPPSLYVGEGVVLGDRRHLLRRAHHDFFRGRLSLGRPLEVEPAAARWDALWDESTPILAATTLGL